MPKLEVSIEKIERALEGRRLTGSEILKSIVHEMKENVARGIESSGWKQWQDGIGWKKSRWHEHSWWRQSK